jgi:hypothetical protein
MLKDGEPDPEDPYDPDAVDGEDMTPVKIMEGVRYAAGNDANTLAILEDGSLWELPNAHSVSRQIYTEEEFAKVGTSPRKLLDRAADVTWFEAVPDALPPTLLDPPQIEGLAEEISEDTSITAEETMVEEMTVPWLALIASLLPLAAAAAYHLWKRT